ncbi:hypothetical protein PMAYCL1PPCAC_24931, partial [Pristionchus mayeri]
LLWRRLEVTRLQALLYRVSFDSNRTSPKSPTMASSHLRLKLEECLVYKDCDNWGFSKVCSWEDLIDEEKGFIKDGKIVIEARFTLSKIAGIRIPLSIDFTDSNECRHDVALIIDGEKIYVNKGYLSIHSPVFTAMFYGDFAEKDRKEIELKDIDRMEFIEMLYVIYPSNKSISRSVLYAILFLLPIIR